MLGQKNIVALENLAAPLSSPENSALPHPLTFWKLAPKAIFFNPFVRIFRISFINKDNGYVIKKTAVSLAWEVFKYVLLYACFFSKVFPIIIYVIIPWKTKVIDSLTYIWQFTLITSEHIYNVFVIAVKTMINNILFQGLFRKEKASWVWTPR